MLTARDIAISGPSLFRGEFAMIRSMILSLVCLAGPLAGQLVAQDWAEKMFNKVEHDFGTVARGASTVYRFEVTNLYKQPMHITGVRSSCGCTSPTIENATFKTHDKAYIVAKFNTHTFKGRHGATLTISFGAPYRAEVQVRVHGNIRGDVVFEPGAILFGNVDQGSSTEKQISVNYAGRGSWKIVDITNDNDHFEVELQETYRGTGKVSYGLLVRLKDNMPAGYVKDQLTIVTNDSRSETQRIPLFIEGRVIPEISVTPPSLALGDIAADKPITKKVVVRGKKPFRITEVSCSDERFTFNTDEDSKILHFVEVTYNPSSVAGGIKLPVKITTDRGENHGVQLMISANIKQSEVETATQAENDDQSSTAEEDQVAGTASN
jgi:hypothetical protein